MTGRRGFLAMVAAGVAATWVETAFASGPSARQTELFAAWHAARRLGAPLLVVLVPPQDQDYDRGWLVGAAIDGASPKLLERLAGYAPACATHADLALLGVNVPADAWFTIVETGAVPAAVVAIGGPELPKEVGGAQIDAMERHLLAVLPVRAAVNPEPWASERIPGSHWANATGCGLRLEEADTGMMMGCGMGHVPARGARFLYFFASALDE